MRFLSAELSRLEKEDLNRGWIWQFAEDPEKKESGWGKRQF
jgi:hypothetical protein